MSSRWNSADNQLQHASQIQRYADRNFRGHLRRGGMHVSSFGRSESLLERQVDCDRHARESGTTNFEHRQPGVMPERRAGSTGPSQYRQDSDEGQKQVMKDDFTSIRYAVAINAGLGRLQEEPDFAEHVDQMIRQVLFTSPGDRINRPDFGCGVKRLVFAPNSEVSASLAQVTIFESLKRWLEPVITVNDVKVKAANEVLEIRIVYLLKARQERRYLNLEVTI